MARTSFRPVGEAEVDARRRISLSKAGNPEHIRYSIEENEDGEIRLIPLVSISARELRFLQDVKMQARLEKAFEQVNSGEVSPWQGDPELDDDEDDRQSA